MPKRQYGTGSITWLTTTKARLRIRLKDGSRRTKVATFSHRDHGGRGQATEALALFLAEAEAELEPRTTQTLGEAMDAYVVMLRRIGRSPSTARLYESVRKGLTSELAATVTADLTADALNDYYGVLQARGLEDRTIRTYHACIRAALNEAVKTKRLTENPALAATAPVYHPPDRTRITPAEAWALIVQADREDHVLAVAMFLATFAGARRGELTGLRWEDYDPAAQTLAIARQWIPQVGGQRLADLKSDTGAIEGRRTITLGSGSVRVLERFRAQQEADHRRPPDEWLLSYDGGPTPVSAQALGEAVSALTRRAGLKKVTLHSFRRTSATQLHAAGVDLETASNRMGHTSVVMMRDYVQATDDRAIAAADALEARLIDQGFPIGELLAP